MQAADGEEVQGARRGERRLGVGRQERRASEHRRGEHRSAARIFPWQCAQPSLQPRLLGLSPAREARRRREFAQHPAAAQLQGRPLRAQPGIIALRSGVERRQAAGDHQFTAFGRARAAGRYRDPTSEKGVVAVGHPAQPAPAFVVRARGGAFDPQGEFDEGSPQSGRFARRRPQVMPGHPEGDAGAGEGAYGEAGGAVTRPGERQGQEPAGQPWSGVDGESRVKRGSDQ